MLTRYNKLEPGESKGFDKLKLVIGSLSADYYNHDAHIYIKPLEEAAKKLEEDILLLIEDLEIANENIKSYKESYQ